MGHRPHLPRFPITTEDGVRVDTVGARRDQLVVKRTDFFPIEFWLDFFSDRTIHVVHGMLSSPLNRTNVGQVPGPTPFGENIGAQRKRRDIRRWHFWVGDRRWYFWVGDRRRWHFWVGDRRRWHFWVGDSRRFEFGLFTGKVVREFVTKEIVFVVRIRHGGLALVRLPLRLILVQLLLLRLVLLESMQSGMREQP